MLATKRQHSPSGGTINQKRSFPSSPSCDSEASSPPPTYKRFCRVPPPATPTSLNFGFLPLKRTPLRERCHNSLRVFTSLEDIFDGNEVDNSPTGFMAKQKACQLSPKHGSEKAKYNDGEKRKKHDLVREHIDVILKAYRNGGLGKGEKRAREEPDDESEEDDRKAKPAGTPPSKSTLDREFVEDDGHDAHAPTETPEARPTKRLRVRKNMGDVGKSRSDYVPMKMHLSSLQQDSTGTTPPSSTDKRKDDVPLDDPSYASVMQLFDSIYVSLEDSFVDPAQRFTHVIRVVCVANGEELGAESTRIRIRNKDLSGVHQLDLIVPLPTSPTTSDSADSDTDSNEGTSPAALYPELRLTARQLRAGRDLMSLALPFNIRPESPRSFIKQFFAAPHCKPSLDYARVMVHGAKDLSMEIMALVCCYATYAMKEYEDAKSDGEKAEEDEDAHVVHDKTGKNSPTPEYILQNLAGLFHGVEDWVVDDATKLCMDSEGLETVRKVSNTP